MRASGAARAYRRPGRGEAGFAIADFVAGVMILTSVITTYAALDALKFETLDAARDRGTALRAASSEMEQLATSEGAREIGAWLAGGGARQGSAHALVRRFEIEGLRAPDAAGGAAGSVEAREHGAGLIEVVVRVRWRERDDREAELHLVRLVAPER